MRKLRVLVVGDAYFSVGPKHLPNTLRVLDWNGYPSPFLPSDFHPSELSILRLRYSCIKLDKPLKMFDSLGCMDFEGCKCLVQVPNLSRLPNLKELRLDNCTNLIKVDDSIGFLDKLISLSARGCIKLDTFVPAINLPSLENLDLLGCKSLQRFPEVLGVMENIREVCLEETGIGELPDSISNLVGLERLDLMECRYLSHLPVSIALLPKLEVFLFHHQRGVRLYEPDIGQEAVEFRGLMLSEKVVEFGGLMYRALVDRAFVSFRSYDTHGAKMHKSYIIGRKGSLLWCWFRKRFPEGTLWYFFDPSGTCRPGSTFELSISVLINGTFQFSSSHVYIYYYNAATVLPRCVGVRHADLLRGFPQDVVKRVFSLQEWNHAEISCELKCHMPHIPVRGTGDQSRSVAVSIKQSNLFVSEQDYCKKDVKFPDCDVKTMHYTTTVGQEILLVPMF